MRPVAIILLAGTVSCFGSLTEPTNPLGRIGTVYRLTGYDETDLPTLYSASLGVCGGQVRNGSLTAVDVNRALFSVTVKGTLAACPPVVGLEGVISTSVLSRSATTKKEECEFELV